MWAAGDGPDPGFSFGVGGVLLTVLGAVVVGVLALAGVIYTARSSKSAQDKSAEIDERRVKLEEERVKNEAQTQRHTELRDYTDRIERELVQAREALSQTRVDNDRRSDAQAARCASALSSAMDTVHVLQKVVRDEIAAAAADVAIEDALLHTTTDHPAADPPEGQAPPIRP